LEQGGSQTSSVNAKGHILKNLLSCGRRREKLHNFSFIKQSSNIMRLVPNFNALFSNKSKAMVVIKGKFVCGRHEAVWKNGTLCGGRRSVSRVGCFIHRERARGANGWGDFGGPEPFWAFQK